MASRAAAYAEARPLRVLRAMQFAARFEFSVAPETVALCASLTQADLPPERLMEEWTKLLLRGRKPSLGLRFLRDCGWTRFYPELHAMIDVPQDPEWHPEGCVWTHTAHCLDAFAQERVGVRDEDLVVSLAVLLHDIGKAADHEMEGGHPAVGAELLKRYGEKGEVVHAALVETLHTATLGTIAAVILASLVALMEIGRAHV